MTQERHPPDAELVRQALAGRRESFDALVERHFGLVYMIALGRLGSDDSARDLAQEVFLRAFLHLKNLRDGDKFAPWVARMTRNLGIQWLRSRQTASRLIPLVHLEAEVMETLPDRTPRPGEAMAREEEAAAVRQAMMALPPNEREAVLLHYVEGRPKNEIAKHLGLHPANVGRMLERACARMKPGLAEKLGLGAPTVRSAVRAPEQARADTVACIALAAALSPGMRESLAAAAVKGLPAAVSVYTTHSKGIAAASIYTALLQNVQAWLASGAMFMGYGKAAIVGAAIVAAVAGVKIYNAEPATPPPATTSARATPATIPAAPANPSGGEPLKIFYPVVPGLKWRATIAINQEGDDGVQRLTRTSRTRCEIMGRTAAGELEVRMTVENDEKTADNPEELSASMAGQSYILTLHANQGIKSIRSADGKPLDPNNASALSHLFKSLAFVPKPPANPVAKGMTWTEQVAFPYPDQPESKIAVKADCVYEGIETRDGKSVGVIRCKDEGTISKLLVSRRPRGVGRVEATLDGVVFSSDEVCLVDPASGRIMQKISDAQGKEIEMNIVMFFPKGAPMTQKVPNHMRASHTVTTFEYL